MPYVRVTLNRNQRYPQLMRQQAQPHSSSLGKNEIESVVLSLEASDSISNDVDYALALVLWVGGLLMLRCERQELLLAARV